MTYTVSENCDSIAIQSDLITNWIANQDNTSYSLEINVTINSGNVTTVIPSLTIIDETEGILTLTEDLVTDTFKDSVVHVELVELNDTVQSTDDDCVLALCDIKCKIANYTANNLTSDLMYFYEALLLAGECGECDCKNAVEILNYIIIKLQDVDTNCGCN